MFGIQACPTTFVFLDPKHAPTAVKALLPVQEARTAAKALLLVLEAPTVAKALLPVQEASLMNPDRHFRLL